ncbi:alanyl-tRNA editing protein Aarsd1-like [Styela clava]
MPFMCQNDSYSTLHTAVVQTVTPAKCKVSISGGKEQMTEGYEVILDDTILFPEGGGQPDDRGTIDEVPVLRVTRRGGDAVHFVPSKLEEGQEVKLKVDWERRFDHMQQHTGQHLITAIVDKKFGHQTTSWDLGRNVSFIELDTLSLTIAQMQEVEDECNQKIRDSTPVTVHVTEVGSTLLENVRARGLPEDHVGSVRIIDINGVDANMCCGTHVKNLSDLQCVKLLSVEKGKKGKCNLYFLVGNRVLDFVAKKYADEKSLTKILKCGPIEHVEAVERSVKQLKQTQKEAKNLLREVASFEAKSFKLSVSENRYLRLHRKEGNNEYMNIVANELKGIECYLFLTVGDEKGEGLFLLSGPDKFLEECGKNISDAIQGKGAMNAGKIQGKALNMKGCKQAEELIRTFMSK